MSELKPIAYAIYGIGGGKLYLKDVKPIPADDLTEEWRGDDDFLGDYWAGNKPLFLGRTQPEATKPAQDLSAAILAMKEQKPTAQQINDLARRWGQACVSSNYADSHSYFNFTVAELHKFARELLDLASPADALIAGDSETAKDATSTQEADIAVSVKTRVTNFGVGGAILVKDVHRIIDEEMHAISAARKAKENGNG